MMYNGDMARQVINMSQAEATRDFGSLLAPVRGGAEVAVPADEASVPFSPWTCSRDIVD